MVKIVFSFQGEENILWEVPDNVKRVVFHIPDNYQELYSNVKMQIPIVQDIEFYENTAP